MRSPDAEGVGRLLADPTLIGKRTIRGTGHGLAGAGLGAGGGALIGGGVGGRRGALIGALMGTALGGAIGQTHGMHSVDKEWLAERGITPTMLGMGRGKFTREAAEKYLKD